VLFIDAVKKTATCPEFQKKKFRKTGSQTRGVRLINPEEVSYTPEAEAQETEQPKPDIRREFFELIRLVIVFLLVFWAVKFFIVEGYEVQGESMLPTLADKDRILVFKLPQHLHKVPPFQRWQPFHTGDILVLDGFGNKRLIKRLIAYNPRQPGRTVNAQSETDAPSVQDGVKVEFDRASFESITGRSMKAPICPKRCGIPVSGTNARLPPVSCMYSGTTDRSAKTAGVFMRSMIFRW